MIIKIMGHKGGGSVGATMDYMLGKKNDRENTRILQGDPQLTRELAESLKFKNKHTVGVLSFEEQNIKESDKYEIIERFEKAVFNGLDKDQYNITWIEHTDKGRLEMNFVIANVELHTGKRLQPYYDKADRPLLENLKQAINHEYGLTDPHDPSKKRVANNLNINDLPKQTKEFKQRIDQVIIGRVKDGSLKNRDDVIELLKASGLEISRITDKSISIKNNDPKGRNIKLTGAIYENGRPYSELRAEQRESKKLYEAEKQESYATALSKLERAVARRGAENQGKYKRNDEVYISAIDDRNSYRNVATNDINIIRSNLVPGEQSGRADHSTKQPKQLHNTENQQQEPKIMGENRVFRGRQSNIHHSNRQTANLDEQTKQHSIISEVIKKGTEYGNRFREYASDLIRKLGAVQQKINDTGRTIANTEQAITNTERELIKTTDEKQRAVVKINRSIREFNSTAQPIQEQIKITEKKQDRGMGMGRH